MTDAITPAAILTMMRTMPWVVRNEIARMVITPAAHLRFALAGIAWGEGWRMYGLPILQIYRGSQVQIGAGFTLRSTPHSNPLSPYHPVMISTRTAAARLTIGVNFGMTGGGIICAQQVTIGDHVTIGANTILTDTDFHPLDAPTRRTRPSDAATAPIVIGDDVFIGMGAIILKGVTIGTGSVIGAGSVVTRDVPPGVIAAGNPARVVRAV